MIPKRFLDDENVGSELPVQDSKRQHRSLLTVLGEVRTIQSLQGVLSELEPFLRRVVHEEVEHALVPYICSSFRFPVNHIQASGANRWQLHFKNRLTLPLFTGSKIEAEDNEPIHIVIFDSSSGQAITSGALSSIKVEILVLDGDFGSDEQEDWTEKEFDSSVIRERAGKRPLLTGDLVVTLRDGVGTIGELSFTDNSSWLRSRKFRLGARVVRSSYNGERIREARTEAFMVKDHRGELYRKHHPPSLSDEVWRLEKIGKDGAFHSRLAANGINTVEDFLRLLVVNHSMLHNILRMSSKTWEATVEHARTCVLDTKLYKYYTARQQVVIFLNSIYEVVGAAFDGQSYQPLCKLSKAQAVFVEDLKQHAYSNLDQLFEINRLSTDIIPRPLPRLDAPASPGPGLDMRYTDFQLTGVVTHQDELAPQLDFNHPTNMFAEGPSQLTDMIPMRSSNPAQRFDSTQRNDFNMMDFYYGARRNYGNEWYTSQQGHFGSVLQSEQAVGNNFQVQIPGWFPGHATRGQGSGWFQGLGDEPSGSLLCPLKDFGVQLNRNCKANLGWLKLRAALKWWCSVRKGVAARRARILEFDF